MTTRPENTKLLRLALQLDAVATAAVGLAAAVAGPLLDRALGVPTPVLVATGAALTAYAVMVWLVAAQRRISVAAATAVVALNLAWVVGSVLVAAVGWLPLTVAGVAVVLAQAAAVAALADLQVIGVRRARAA